MRTVESRPRATIADDNALLVDQAGHWHFSMDGRWAYSSSAIPITSNSRSSSLELARDSASFRRTGIASPSWILHLVMEMVADASFRQNLAGMQEEEIRAQGRAVAQPPKLHFAGSAVNCRKQLVGRWIVMGNSLLQRRCGASRP